MQELEQRRSGCRGSATQGAVAELALLGWLLGGGSGVVWAAVTGIMVLVLWPRASALNKLDHYQGGLLRRILLPGGRIPDSWILSTHPRSQERIRRPTELAETWPRPVEALALVENPFDFPDERLALRRLPGWHLSRLEL